MQIQNGTLTQAIRGQLVTNPAFTIITNPTVLSTGLSIPSSTGSAVIVGDPQLVGFLGQRFQVHCIDGTIYNLITGPDLQINARFGFLSDSGSCPIVPSTGLRALTCWTHPGSYLTEIGIQVVASETGIHQVYLRAGEATQGFASIRYDAEDALHMRSVPGSQALNLKVLSTHEVQITVSRFVIEIESIDRFVNLRSIKVQMPLSRIRTHGLMGQTWRRKVYPGRNKYLEGEIEDYVIGEDDLFGVDFPYNQFNRSQVVVA